MLLKNIRVDGGIDSKTNCYIVQDEKTKETMVIDPGGDVQSIVELLDALKANLKYIYLTHCHVDHITGVKELKNIKGGKILVHRDEAEGLHNIEINLRGHIGLPPEDLYADIILDDGDLIHIGDIELKVIHTPGHTKGSSSLYCEKEGMLFSGDTMFKGTWGRTDLPTSSFEDIIKSISNKLLVLPDDTIVYPGHGKATRIADEQPLYYNLMPAND